MKVLIVHNQYQHRGGEDSVVENESELLQSSGHEVFQHIVDNHHIHGIPEKVRTLLNLSYSDGQKDRMLEILREVSPDVMHVHNFFPVLTPSIFDAAIESGVPSVMTLHNYRLICAGAMLMRNQQPCEDCISHSPYQAILHSCYRNSRVGSVALAYMIDRHQKRQTWNTKIDCLITLTEFARSRFVSAGFNTDKIAIKPNFARITSEPDHTERHGALFVGRLSAEKGLKDLIEAWRNLDIPLSIAGDGPLQNDNNSSKNIRFLGAVDKDQVQLLMRQSSLLIVPSIWYEGFPMVIIEAYANGLPVAASNLGSLSEVVKPGRTGFHFKPGDANSLAKTVTEAFSDGETLRAFSKNAFDEYRKYYTPETNLEQLESIYASVIRKDHDETA